MLPFCRPCRGFRTHRQVHIINGATTQRAAGMAQQRRQRGSDGGAQQAAEAGQQERRKSLLPVCFRDGQITVGDGLPMLDNVTPQASINHGSEILVLSLKANNGPACLEDFPLGQVGQVDVVLGRNIVRP